MHYAWRAWGGHHIAPAPCCYMTLSSYKDHSPLNYYSCRPMTTVHIAYSNGSSFLRERGRGGPILNLHRLFKQSACQCSYDFHFLHIAAEVRRWRAADAVANITCTKPSICCWHFVSTGDAMLSAADDWNNFAAVYMRPFLSYIFLFFFHCLSHFPALHPYFKLLTCREATAIINQLYSVDSVTVIRLGYRPDQADAKPRPVKVWR